MAHSLPISSVECVLTARKKNADTDQMFSDEASRSGAILLSKEDASGGSAGQGLSPVLYKLAL